MSLALEPQQSSAGAQPPAFGRRLGLALIALGQRLAGQPAVASAPLGTNDTGDSQPANTPAAPSAAAGEAPIPPRTVERREGGDRFASLASMIPGVVYQRIVTPQGDIRYTYISEGARDMFGVAPEDVMNDPEALFRTFSEDYKASFRQRLVAASEALEKWDVEASIVGADGRMRYTHAIATPERLADGSTLWTGLILDANRIKLVEEELKAANRSVEAANNAKSLFLANMSHEIRTPMNGVLGMADLLLKTNLNIRQNRLLNTLRHSAKTLLGIINDVLDISRIEAGRFDLETEPFELCTCLEDAVDLCAGAAYQKGLELGLVVEGDMPGSVLGDVGRLRQVLINLVGNAVKFTEAGSATVRVKVQSTGPQTVVVRIQVIDTGIGIASAARETLFAPFSQADSSISRKFGGTGLGLAITRHLVTLMGGCVELDSEIGRGTTVTVEIPYTLAPPSTHVSPGHDLLAGERILIADNRAVVREALASKLNKTGAEISFAADELEATALLRWAVESKRPFKHLLVDRIRPNSDNVAFCATIESDPKFAATGIVRIVSMTWKDGQTGEKGNTTAPVLQKPVRRSELLALLAGDPTVSEFLANEDAGSQISDDVAPTQLGLHILLAEDNPVNQEVALEYLTSFGCTFEIANNGEEAIAAFVPGKFDLVMMDCQMPVLDGLSAVRAIRELEREEGAEPTPILAVTANAYDSDRVEAKTAGMDDYLVKPFSDLQLLDLLEKWTQRESLAA